METCKRWTQGALLIVLCQLILAGPMALAAPPAGCEDPVCWKWQWTHIASVRGGASDEAVLTMCKNHEVSLDKYNPHGTWSATGDAYTIDWGRGAGKEDKMTMTSDGKQLTGKNAETTSITGTKMLCP